MQECADTQHRVLSNNTNDYAPEAPTVEGGVSLRINAPAGARARVGYVMSDATRIRYRPHLSATDPFSLGEMHVNLIRGVVTANR